MKPNYWLVLSSLTLIAPAIVCHKTGDHGLKLMYILLTTVSSVYHATKNPYLVYLDYSCAQLTNAYSLYIIIKGGWASMPCYSLWLSYIMIVYYYGYINKSLIWNPDLDAATP